jgi:dipeptidase D
MKHLSNLQPQPLFNYFEDICQVPRPSKKEEKIRRFLLGFAGSHNLATKTDEAGNVLISKAATPGRESAPVVILQTHMDMVCEKNRDKKIDFENDPIEPYIENGWVKADGTTLGADCGIGIAAQLTVLTSEDISHGPLECLITVDEETGLTGAFALKPGFMAGSVLLNLDSEEEGEIFIGCAGGIDSIATFTAREEKVPDNAAALKLSVTGLQGGHSGDDIEKQRGNANKILNRFLWQAVRQYDIGLAEFDGGNLRNAIPREARAFITVDKDKKDQVISGFKKFTDVIKNEYQFNEPDIIMEAEETDLTENIIDKKTRNNLINALYACPHGILEMSTRMEGMVETSTNLASVKFQNGGKIIVTTSQRSELESRKYYASEMVASLFELAGAQVEHSDGYPGWTPNPDSKLLKTAIDAYKRLFDKEPAVRSIHAGLECGLFLEKYPHLDMISFGPTIRGAHSPAERLDIESTGKFWQYLKEILEAV